MRKIAISQAEFKNSARRLKLNLEKFKVIDPNESLVLSHSTSLNVLAEALGFKNYNQVNSVFKSNTEIEFFEVTEVRNDYDKRN